jgi:hypothetical protein
MEDPKKMAQRQAIEQRRLENARRVERQGSQQPSSNHEMVSRVPGYGLLRLFDFRTNNRSAILQHDRQSVQPGPRADLGHTRAPSRLGSVQPFSRSITQPPSNPAKPVKRHLDDESRAVAPTMQLIRESSPPSAGKLKMSTTHPRMCGLQWLLPFASQTYSRYHSTLAIHLRNPLIISLAGAYEVPDVLAQPCCCIYYCISPQRSTNSDSYA